jgi:hypothetical protein
MLRIFRGEGDTIPTTFVLHIMLRQCCKVHVTAISRKQLAWYSLSTLTIGSVTRFAILTTETLLTIMSMESHYQDILD